MYGRLIMLDKKHGVRPVGVRVTWRSIFSKIVLKVTGLEAIMACKDDRLCARLKAGIDSAIHEVQALWDENLTTEEWGFCLWTQKTRSMRLIEP